MQETATNHMTPKFEVDSMDILLMRDILPVKLEVIKSSYIVSNKDL